MFVPQSPGLSATIGSLGSSVVKVLISIDGQATLVVSPCSGPDVMSPDRYAGAVATCMQAVGNTRMLQRFV